MSDFFYSIFLGLVQGITEFLPISSTGHLVIFRDFFGLNVSYGLAFDAVLQLATAISVCVYFRKDLLNLFRSFFKKSIETSEQNPDSIQPNKQRKLLIYLIVGTIPAVILGLLFENLAETSFRNTVVVAVALVVGSFVMLASEKFIKEKELSTGKAVIIGLFQSLAIVPGMSRAGMTISGGYFLGLKKELAIRFSFLLSIPIIAGSGLYKLIEIIGDTALFSEIWLQLIVGSISAFVFGILSIDFLIKFLKKNSFKVFVIYRLLLAILLLILAI